MIGIPIGIAYASLAEWLIHKHVLHELGRQPGNFFQYHWLHHRNAKLNGLIDEDYRQPLGGWNGQTKEIASLLGAAALHLPLLPVAPFFTCTLFAWAARYWFLHRHAHLDPDWAREHLPWHVDHHLNRNPNANWGVTQDWWDRILGTREASNVHPGQSEARSSMEPGAYPA
jgi:sterol desaturase/sphingolipid hydroxylase (fatty acid hydroxylase superfamily)